MHYVQLDLSGSPYVETAGARMRKYAVDERDGHTCVYPIPADVRALNHNLEQNPGY